MEGQLETAHLFWVTHNFEISRNSPALTHILLVPGFAGFRQERKDKFQPESCSKHTSDLAGKSPVQEREPEVFCTSSLLLFQSLVGFALGQIKPLVMAGLQLYLNISLKTVLKPLQQGGDGRAR